MNRDDILLAMKKVGAAKHDLMPKTYEGVVDVFERFAALVRADEREQCAALADAERKNIGVLLSYPAQSAAAYQIGIAIRARSNT